MQLLIFIQIISVLYGVWKAHFNGCKMKMEQIKISRKEPLCQRRSIPVHGTGKLSI